MADRVFTVILHHVRRLSGDVATDAPSDRELLERFTAQRDESAFAALVQRHGPLVWAVCRRQLPRQHDAEDAFQAVFLVLVRKASSVPWRESMGGWLHTVAQRVARDARVRSTRQRSVPDSMETIQPSSPAPDPGRTELWQLLAEELQRLPAQERGPLVLCYLEGKSHDEAAKELGVPRGSMAKLLARARGSLRQCLDRRGVGLSLGALALALEEGPNLAAAPAVLAGSAGISATVTQLVEGALHTMKMAKRLTAALLLAMAMAVGTGGLLMYSALVGRGQGAAPATAKPEERRPEEDRRERTDLHGDPLPPDALVRMGTIRFRPIGDIRTLAFLPGGKTLATFDRDGMVLVWDVNSGKEIARWEVRKDGHPAFGREAAFSANGKLVVVSTGKTIFLLDAVTGKERWRGDGHLGYIAALAFSPDGKLVASAGSNSLFSEKGELISGGGIDGDPSIRVWDVATGKEKLRVQGTREGTTALAFSPDGQTLASGPGGYSDRTIGLWDVATGKKRHRLDELQHMVGALAFSPDGRVLVSGSDARTLRYWDVATGKGLGQSIRVSGAVRSLAYSPDGKFLASGGSLEGQSPVPDGEGNPDVVLWETSTGRVLRHWPGPAACTSVRFSADGKLLAAAGTDGTLRLWDPLTGKEHFDSFSGHQGAVTLTAFAPDGRTLASAGADGFLRLWESDTGRPLHTFERLEGSISFFRFHPDGKNLIAIAGGADPIHVWDSGGKELRRFGGKLLHPSTAALSPDGKILAVGDTKRVKRGELEGVVRLWELATGKELRGLSFEAGVEMASPEAFSPDGATLAVVVWQNVGFGLGEPKVRLWNLAAGREMVRLHGQPAWCAIPEFSPDGRTLLTRGDYESPALVWELASGQVRRRLTGQGGMGASGVFSADGRRRATHHRDTIYLWDADSAEKLHEFHGHKGAIFALAFSPDGRKLVSGSQDTTALVWDLSVIAGVKRLPTDLSLEQIRQSWEDLAGNAEKAQQALTSMRSAPAVVVPFLSKELRPAAVPDARQEARWLDELDDAKFEVREKAEKELEKLDDLAEPALRERLKRNPGWEAHRRMERLLDNLTSGGSPAGEKLRGLRAIELLEQINTPESRKLLRTLADGAPGARLTREARAALARLL
jgi:RNA polymerase sigma factor (sigma-70 family)